MIAKLLGLLFLYALTFGVSIFTMMVGWGLSPANWPALVLGWIVLTGISGVIAIIGSK